MKTKRLKPPERQRTILSAACDLFAKNGYRGMTTQRLAKRLGISEPVIYRHFDSKKDLFERLLENVISEVKKEMLSLTSAQTNPLSALRELVAAYPRLAGQHASEFRLINRSLVEAGDEPTRKALRAHYSAY